VASNLQERLRSARTNVWHACELLLSPTPEILDQCSALLETTAREMVISRPEPAGNESALQDARQLYTAVRRARVLLDSAFVFRQAWRRRLAGMTAGYTARGEPARVDPSFRLTVRG